MAHHDPHDDIELLEADFEDPEPSATWFYTIAGGLVLIATVLAVAAVYYNSFGKKLSERVVDVDINEIETLKAGHQAQLDADARWIDRDEGVIAIPIDDAKDLVIREYGGSARAAANGTD